MVDTLAVAKDLQREIKMKDQLIDALPIKLRQKQDLLDDMIDERSIIKIGAICDTYISSKQHMQFLKHMNSSSSLMKVMTQWSY